MKGFLEETTGPYVYGRWIKLKNRRVALFRTAEGAAVMCFHALRGWKNVSKIKVGLSPQATEALLQLLLDSQSKAKYAGQTIKTS